ncbi:hypothetical protein ACFQZ4_13030 [Catellatospora coxensis]
MADDTRERQAGSGLAAAVTLPVAAFAVAAGALLAWAVADALSWQELVELRIDGAAHGEDVAWRWVGVIGVGAVLILAALIRARSPPAGSWRPLSTGCGGTRSPWPRTCR